MFKNGSRRGRGRGTKLPPGPVTCDSSLWAPWGNQDSQETCVEDALRFCCRWRPRALLLPCVLWHPEQGAGSGVLTSHDVRKTVLPGQGQLISSANTKWSWGPTFPTGKGTTLPGLPLSSEATARACKAHGRTGTWKNTGPQGGSGSHLHTAWQGRTRVHAEKCPRVMCRVEETPSPRGLCKTPKCYWDS